jgi:hypothetical protein
VAGLRKAALQAQSLKELGLEDQAEIEIMHVD